MKAAFLSPIMRFFRTFATVKPRAYIFLLLAFAAMGSAVSGRSYAGRPAYDRPDSWTDTLRLAQRTDRFYDSLAVRSQGNVVTRLLYSNLFRSIDSTISAGRAVDERLVYEPFRGKRIASITIRQEATFGDSPTRLARWADNVHVTTRRWVINNYIIFNVGDAVDPAVIVKDMQLLTSTGFIYRAWIDMAVSPSDSTMVDVTVTTRDKWSLGLDLDLDISGRSTVAVYDANILGLGHRLSVGANFSDSPWEWGGVMAGYTMPNLFGTFIRGEGMAGVDFDTRTLRAAISKDIILPTDYAGGVSYTAIRAPTYLICYDTTSVVGLNTSDAWLGGALFAPWLGSSFFATARLYEDTYTLRPDVAPDVNPGYYNFTRFMAGLGIYREKFYTTSLIYGYGTNEYLPVGYKAQMVGGYSREQFGGNYYMGFDISGGVFGSGGSYITGSASIGSFLSDGGPLPDAPRRWNRSSVSAQGGYVTRLLRAGRSRIRNLTSVSYIHGWNRMTGCDEMVGFTPTDGLRGFDRYIAGRSRVVLNNETVLFTPFAPYGFRIACFGYGDFGLIGDNNDIFSNDFFGTVGLGVRIHNDRLVFPALQIRLGVFFGKPGWVGGRFFSVSGQQSLRPGGFTPGAPDIEPYR